MGRLPSGKRARKSAAKSKRKRLVRQCVKAELEAVKKQWNRDAKRAKREAKAKESQLRSAKKVTARKRKANAVLRLKAELDEVTKKWQRDQKVAPKSGKDSENDNTSNGKLTHKQRMKAEPDEVTKKWQPDQKAVPKSGKDSENHNTSNGKLTHKQRMKAELDEVTRKWQIEKEKEVQAKGASKAKMTSTKKRARMPKSDRKKLPLTDKQRASLIHSRFMKPHRLSFALQHIVGKGPLPRPEVIKRLWAYIKTHDLQDATDRRVVVPDVPLARVLGEDPIDMFKMQQVISKHLGLRSRVTDFVRF